MLHRGGWQDLLHDAERKLALNTIDDRYWIGKKRILIIRSAPTVLFKQVVETLKTCNQDVTIDAIVRCVDQNKFEGQNLVNGQILTYTADGAYNRWIVNDDIIDYITNNEPDVTIAICHRRAGLDMLNVFELLWNLCPVPLIVYQGVDRRFYSIDQPNLYISSAQLLCSLYGWHDQMVQSGEQR